MRLNKQVLRRVTAILLAVMICCGDLGVPMQQVVAYATETAVIPETTATQEPLPATETPATEVPVTEVPVTEVPVTEVPVTEVPATEVPVTEAPPAETVAPKAVPAPVTEVPATATPVPVTEVTATETPAPVTEIPATETPAPVTEAPATETPAPATEVPATETPAPATEIPATETPAPATEVPATETPAPATEVPVTETPAPATEVPATETPVPVTEVPATETPAPATEVPATETPAPATEVPATETPTPATEVPATETPAPVTEVPATETPAPATEVPATETPAPATEIPATEVPVTETPAPVQLVLSAGKSIYQLGETVLWTVSAENAETVSYTVADQNGQTVASGDLNGSSVSYLPEASGVYTLAAVAAAGDQNGFASSSVTVEEANGYVTLTTSPRFAVVEHEAMSVQAAFDGGLAPYTVQIEITRKGEAVYTDESVHHEAGSVSAVYMPHAYGDHEVKVIVTDALGNRSSASSTVPVSANVYESEKDWEESVSGVRLTGDWRQDLVSVARTQLGVEESDRNFIIDEAGTRRGYTRYGHWYGSLYSEWCAMFISFCMRYADIPAAALPREAHVGQWRSQLRSMDVYEQELDQYVPGKGDLIFFDWDADGELEHVGIVTQVKDDTVYTIEGNSRSKVKENSYALSDERIAGYASMSKVMDRAGILEKFEQIDLTVSLTAAPTATPVPGDQLDVTVDLSTNGLIEAVYGYTNKPGVNVREKASVKSDRVEQIKQNTQVKILSRETVKDELWYFVDVEGKQGYILGDLLSLSPAIHISNAQQCTCEAQADETGEMVHAETCALYVAPEATREPEVIIEITATEVPAAECTCEAQADENGETVHAETCALYVAPEATQEPEVVIEITATEAPVDECTCEVQADENGETVHDETCALYVAPEATQEPEVIVEITATEAPVVECTCEAQPDEAGETVHAETCALYVAPEATQEPEVVIEIMATEAPVVECTCEAQPDEAGETVHAETCALYVAPEATQEPEVIVEITVTEAPVVECTCEAQADENGEIIHAEDCALNAVVEEAGESVCTCEAQPDENGETIHAEDCALNVTVEEPEAPVCTCEAQPDENGEIIHAEDCALNAVVEEAKESVCTCEAQPDENGEIIHAEDCALNVTVEEPETPVCTCEAQPDENGEIIHAEDCALNATVEEAAADEEQVVEAGYGETVIFEVAFMEDASYRWQRRLVGDEQAEWHFITDDSIALGWDSHALSVVVSEEALLYEYRCYIERIIPEAGAALNVTLIERLFGVHTAYAQETEGYYTGTYQIMLLNASSEASSEKTIHLEQYTSQNISELKIYSAKAWTSTEANRIQTSTADGSILLQGKNESIKLIIGDQPSGEGDSAGDTVVLAADIELAVNGASAADVTMKKVNGGNHAVAMTVTADSSFQNVTLESGAKLKMVLSNADLTLSSLVVPADAALEIEAAANCTLTVGSITGGGSITITGNGNVKVNGKVEGGVISVTSAVVEAASIAAAKDFEMDAAKITAESITAKENMTLINGEIQNAKLLGFDTVTNNEHTLTIQQTKLTHVERVGAADGMSDSVVFGAESAVGDTTATNLTFVADYVISYQESVVGSTAEVIEPKDSWLVRYRAKTTALNASAGTVLSALQQNGNAVSADFNLPADYQKDGYHFEGWTIPVAGTEGVTEQVLSAIDGKAGHLVLTAKLTPYRVLPKVDLGYTPSELTNDTEVTLPVYDETVFGKEIDLPTVYRFGWKFEGWNVVTGTQTNGDQTTDILLKDPQDESKDYLIPADATEYKIDKVAHLIAPAEGEEQVYQLQLKGKWVERSYPITLSLDQQTTGNILEISVDGGTNWGTVENFLAQYEDILSVSEDGLTISVAESHWIKYGQTIAEWFDRLGCQNVPIFRLTDPTGKKHYTFSGWYVNEQLLAANACFSNDAANGGILARGQEHTTWAALESALTQTPKNMKADFSGGQLLTVHNKPNDWSFYQTVEGQMTAIGFVQAADNSQTAIIQTGATVTLSLTDSDLFTMGITPWAIKQYACNCTPAIAADGKVTHEDTCTIGTAADATITSLPYTKGDAQLSYTFTMSADTVAAWTDLSTTPVYIDLAQSPITFDEKVAHNTFELNGFWYNEPNVVDRYTGVQLTPTLNDSSKGYFYAWEKDMPVYVTTSAKTPNQLVLIDAAEVHLKDCTMEPREAYTNDFVGRNWKEIILEKKVNGTSIPEAQDNAWKDYGNVVLNNSTHRIYTTNLYIHGENSIGSIMQNQYMYASEYKSAVKLHAGTEKDSNGSSIKAVLNLGGVFGNMDLTFANLTINEYNKAGERDGDNSEYLAWVGTAGSTQGNVRLNSCEVNTPNKRVLSGYGYIYFDHTDAVLGSTRHAYLMDITASNLHLLKKSYAQHYGMSLKNKSTVVLEEDFMFQSYSSGGTFDVNSGSTLVCKGNYLYAGALSLSGTLIANVVGIGGKCSITGGKLITNQLQNLSKSRLIDDTVTGTEHNGTVEAKENGDDYPFKNYANNQKDALTYSFTGGSMYLLGYYPSTGTLFDTSFTAKSDGNPLKEIVEEYEANGTTKLTHEYLLEKVEKAKTDRECVVIGNSAYHTGVCTRSVSIQGAKIYAAGNLTFFNSTKISGDKTEIYCLGTLSSKHDLEIAGGTVTAAEIGNSYAIEHIEDKLTRWATTTINGGTVKTDRLGAMSANIKGVEAKSALKIADAAVIQPLNGETIAIVDDIYVNYLAGEEYTKPAENVNTLRYSGTMTSAADTLENTQLTLQVEEKFAPPTLTAGGTEAQWRHGSLLGEIAVAAMNNGHIRYDNGYSSEKAYIEDTKLALYATKEAYTLTVMLGDDYIQSITQTRADQEPEVLTLDPSVDEPSVSVAGDALVTITLSDSAMASKTVAWYEDSLGMIHNVSQFEASGSTVTFTMPRNDAELRITNELPLYLDKSSLTFTRTGFATEAGSDRRSDSNFDYRGSLIVAMKDQKTTTNRMVFESGADDIADRTFTFQGIAQDYDGSNYGVDIAANEKITIWIDGENKPRSIHAPGETGQITLCGVPDEQTDTLQILTSSSETYYLISATKKDEQCAAILVENLTFMKSRGVLGMGAVNTTNDITFRDCVVKSTSDGWYAYCKFGENMDEVIFDHCQVDLATSTDTAQVLFKNVNAVRLINETTFNYTYGGHRATNGHGGYPIYFGTKQLIVENSHITTKLRTDSADTNVDIPAINQTYMADMILRGNSTYVADKRMRIKSLTLTDNAKLSFSDSSDGGYLLCPNIVVRNNAQLNAGHILVSGFYTGTEIQKPVVQAAVAQGTPMLDGAAYPGLVIEGGTVTADMVGGNINAKVTILGGELNANVIGANGLLYGYAGYIPKPGEDIVYTSAKIPAPGTAVNIQGGTVNVSKDGYLGGMNAAVNITGGTINMESGARIGLTDEDSQTMVNDAKSKGQTLSNACNVTISGGKVTGTGSIVAPYSTVSINSNTSLPSVDVTDLMADHGTITINPQSNKSGTLEFACKDSTHDARKADVKVTNLLQAKDINLSDSIVVYADKALVNPVEKEDQGTLKLEGSAELHVRTAYGKNAEAQGTSDIDKGTDAVLCGAEYRPIIYHLDEVNFNAAYDANTNPLKNGNAQSYLAGSDEKIPLQDLNWYGRKFMGWYTDPEFTNQITEINPVAYSGDEHKAGLNLYAQWEFEKVTFSVTIPANLPAFGSADFAKEINGISGYAQADQFTFSYPAEIAYSQPIVAGLNLTTNYKLKSLCVNQVMLAESLDAINTSNVVTKTLLDAYQAKVATNDENQKTQLTSTDRRFTIELQGTVMVLNQFYPVFDLNLQNTLPLFAKFPTPEKVPTTVTPTTWSASVEANKKLEDVACFMVEDDLPNPEAPGYTFLGWFTTPNWTDTTGQINKDYAINADNETHFYAHWQANTYQVQFAAGNADGNGITTTATAPNTKLDTAAQTLTATIQYDQPLSSMVYTGAADQAGNLPFAWSKGQAFVQWYAANPKNEADQTVTLTDAAMLFNQSTLGTDRLDVSKPLSIAATFKPIFSQVGITLNAGKGEFVADGTSAKTIENAAYNEPLPGYVDIDAAPEGGVLVDTKSNLDNNHFSIVSTKGDGFDGSNYVTNDFRSQLTRKGYTFGGWYETEEAAGTAVTNWLAAKDGTDTSAQQNSLAAAKGTLEYYPVNANQTLYAAWLPNTYNVHAYEATSVHNKFTPGNRGAGSNNPITGQLRTGEVIDGKKWGINWPTYNSWYVQNAGEEKAAERNLIGFTFDNLDPGHTTAGNAGYETYQKYARLITNITNVGAMFTRTTKGEGENAGINIGSVFELAGDNYDQIDGLTHAVPDYPDGSTFNLYAVYRERSLVFINRYVYNEETYEEVVHTAPYAVYSDFPSGYVDLGEKDSSGHTIRPSAADRNQSITYWAVDTPDNQTHYPLEGDKYDSTAEAKAAYEGQEGQNNGLYLTYASTALAYGRYDIRVYTVYEAKIVDETRSLTSTGKPDQTDVQFTNQIPGSINSDAMLYSLTNTQGLKLVSEEEMRAHLFDASWKKDGKTYTANDTVALILEVYNRNSTVTLRADLSQAGAVAKLLDERAVDPSWTIRVRMVHSAVISQSQTYPVDLQLTFKTKQNQSITYKGLDIILKPTVYQVTYKAQVVGDPVPADVKFTIPTGNVFAMEELDKNIVSTTTAVYTTNLAYGAKLLARTALPTVEGYKVAADGKWNFGSHTPRGYDTPFNYTLSKADVDGITLTTDYVRESYHLHSDASVRQNVTIRAGGTDVSADTQPVLYHDEVRLVDVDENEVLMLSMEVDVKDEITGQVTKTVITESKEYWLANGFLQKEATTYSFRMPAKAVTVSAYTTLEAAIDHHLTAKEPKVPFTNGQSEKDSSYVFTAGAADLRHVLIGQQLYTHKVVAVTGGVTPTTVSAIQSLQKTAGSNYANSTFAFTVSLDQTGDTTGAKDALPTGQGELLGTVAENSKLTITLHNAYALTQEGTAGQFEIWLSTSSDLTKAQDQTNLIKLTVTVDRLKAQINATVPLVLVMQTNIDGGSAAVPDSYYIDNNSSMRLELTRAEAVDATGGETGDVMQMAQSGENLNTQRDKYWITPKSDWSGKILEADGTATTVDGKAVSLDQYNPIDRIATSPLTFVTKEDASQGVRLATIYYTVTIPAEGAEKTPSAGGGT